MKLTPKEISFLAQQMDATEISLFKNINATLDGTEKKSLEEKKVFKNGIFSEEAEEILSIVANADKCTRFILKDKFCIIEKYTYKTNDKVVLVENANGELLFSIPENFNQTIQEISEFTGTSIIKSADIEVLLTSDEMLFFLAMIDIYRKNALRNYIEQAAEHNHILLSEIKEQMMHPTKNSLVQMIKNNYNYSEPVEENIDGIVKQLILKGCMDEKSNYTLINEYAAFANNFLIPDTIILTEVFNLDENNRIQVAGGLCVCAGLKDIMSFIFGDDEIEISSLTGSQMLQMIENFLKCPQIV